MKNITALLMLLLFALAACDTGQKSNLIKDSESWAHNDSIKRNAELKQQLEQKLAVQDSVSRIENEIATLKQAIGGAKAEFEIQRDKLEKIKKFKILRSKEERELQIRQQSDVIYKLENQISELEYQLVNLQVKLDYVIRESDTQ